MASKPVILPETFQGTASWDDWIEHFERVAVVNEWSTNAAKLKWLKVGLTGKAATVLKRLREETRDSYATLKEALKKRFEPESKKELYMAEFQARQKAGTEDWASFADDLRLLAEKAYSGLPAEAQEALALNRFLTQLTNPQISFAARQRQPANVEQAVQYTLECESYLIPHKQVVDTTVAPVSHGVTDNNFTEQLVAAAANKDNPMSVIMNRLDDIECQLNSLSSPKKRLEQSRSIRRVSNPPQIQPKPAVVCFKCGQEGHFAQVVQPGLRCHILINMTNS